MQRKPTRQSRGSNAAEHRHVAWIKERAVCAIEGCKRWGVIAHHCEGATFKHNKVHVGHWFILGLCESCDALITLGNSRLFREKHGPQSLRWQAQLEHYPFKDECPPEVYAAIMDWGK